MSHVREYIIHFALALFVSATALPLVFQSFSGVFPLTCVGSMTALLLAALFEPLRRVNIWQIVTVFFLLVLILLSLSNVPSSKAYETSREYLLYFLVAGVGSLLIVNYPYDYVKFLRVIIIFALIIAPVVVTTNYSRLSYTADNDEWMGKIYAISPYLIGSIHYLFIGEKKLFKVLSIGVLALYSSMVIHHSPRGVIVMIIVSVLFFFIQSWLQKGVSYSRVIARLICLVILIITLSGLLLAFMGRVLDSYDLHWLRKFIETEDISNNRYPFFLEAWRGFCEHPLFGNGVARFHNSEAYPHNIFLQMMYETGVIMVIPFLVLLFDALKTILKLRNEGIYDYRFVTFFFLLSVSQLMFSSYFWKNQSFWLMVWMVIAMANVRRSRV